jgi:transposase
MTAHRHRRHPTELKIRLAESYLNGEGSLKGIAKAHDISHNLLMIWVDKYRRGDLSDEVDFVEKQRTYEAHIAALERKIGQLTIEVDALKKRQQRIPPAADTVSIISGPASRGHRRMPRHEPEPQYLLQAPRRNEGGSAAAE